MTSSVSIDRSGTRQCISTFFRTLVIEARVPWQWEIFVAAIVPKSKSVRHPWDCHDLRECPNKDMEQPSLPRRLRMRNGRETGRYLLALLNKRAKGALVSSKRLCRMFTFLKLAQFTCQEIGSGYGQRSAHACDRRWGMGGVSEADDAGVGPFGHLDLFDDVEVEVGRLIHGV